MTSFTFNSAIPAAPNNPSNDQPDMLTNNISTQAILAVDHVTFNSTGSGGVGSSGGQHLQVTYNGKNTPAAQTDPISTEFTAQASTLAQVTGSASSIAQLFYKNQLGVFAGNPVKVFGNFTTVNVNGAVALTNGINVTSITSSGSGAIYTLALTPNAIVGTTPTIFVQTYGVRNVSAVTYAANTLTISFQIAPTPNQIVYFSLLQV